MEKTLKYGLKDKTVLDIVNTLRKNPKVEHVVLFGSRAKGNFENGSDIDIALMGNQLNLRDILKASIALDDLYLPYKIDLLIYDRIEEKALLEHIHKYGIELNNSESRTQKDFEVNGN